MPPVQLQTEKTTLVCVEAVIFVGLQGAGKTTFYKQRFSATHVRISMDELKTRHREMALLRSCLNEERDFVVDNTNPTVEERSRYIQPAKEAGYRVVAYYFDCDIKDCLERNWLRPGKERIPVPGLFGTRKRMVPPPTTEGVQEVYNVRMDTTGAWMVRKAIRGLESAGGE